MIKTTLQDQIKQALRNHEVLKLDTLRMLSSSLKYAEIDKHGELSEAEELDIVKKEAKKRSDAIEAYMKADAIERAEKEREELAILKTFLPEELSEQEIEKFVEEALASEGSDFGKVMRAVLAKSGGRADGKKVSELVRAKLQ